MSTVGRAPHQLGLTDLVVVAARATRRTVVTAAKVAAWYERQLLGMLQTRLDSAVQASSPLALSAGPTQWAEGVDRRLGRLLDRALEQTTKAGRQELFHKILDQIVPDEARIIGALSDGSCSPLLHVHMRTRAGMLGEAVLENMCLIGRSANLALPHLTPRYVSHLMTLGLVETGPEDPSLKTEYEILGADPGVLRAMRQAARGPLPARIEKQTLRLSALGLELWDAATDAKS